MTAAVDPLLGSDVGGVVVAAGAGSRLGAARPKAFVPLAGQTLLERAVSQMLFAGVSDVVAVVPADLVDEARTLLGIGCQVVPGGADRQGSVALGMAALPQRCRVVLVHDAARCLAPASLMARVAHAVRAGHSAVIPVVPVADTIKQVDAHGVVLATVDRTGLRIAQTPQGFDRDVLERAHAAGLFDPATDDAALVERIGETVVVVPGDPAAWKITTPDDLARAEWLIAQERG